MYQRVIGCILMKKIPSCIPPNVIYGKQNKKGVHTISLKDKNLDFYVEEKTDETRMRKQFHDVLIIGICVMAAMAAYFLNSIISAGCIGIMFLLLGINGLSYNKKSNAFPEQNVLPAAFAVLGLAMGVIPLIGMLLIRFGNLDDDKNTIVLALPEGILLLILGIMTAAYPAYYAAVKKRRCTCYVTATCISPVIARTIKGTRIYEHLWEFPLNGKTVRVSDKIQVTSEKPYAGTTESFIVNPDDPGDLYRKRPFLALFIMFVGIMICVIAILLLIPTCMLLR